MALITPEFSNPVSSAGGTTTISPTGINDLTKALAGPIGYGGGTNISTGQSAQQSTNQAQQQSTSYIPEYS